VQPIRSPTELGAQIAPPALAHEDFEAIEAAVMETVRGRWFLGEFARRRWAEDTARIIAAIERMESRTREVAAAEARARAEAARSSTLLRAIAEMLNDWRSRAAADRAGDLETRLAALAKLDSLDSEAKLRLFD
jgi:hypothetical protein